MALNWINNFLLLISLFLFYYFFFIFSLYFISFLPFFCLFCPFLFTFFSLHPFSLILNHYFSKCGAPLSVGPWAIAHFAHRVSRHSTQWHSDKYKLFSFSTKLTVDRWDDCGITRRFRLLVNLRASFFQWPYLLYRTILHFQTFTLFPSKTSVTIFLLLLLLPLFLRPLHVRFLE